MSYDKSTLRSDFPELFSFIKEGKLAIDYVPYRRVFEIIARDGGFGQVIYYCPWTGRKLPKPLSEEFGDLLETQDLSIFEPDTWPEHWRSEEWWIDRGL